MQRAWYAQLPQDLSDFDAFAQRIEHAQLHFASLGIIRGRVRTIRDVSNSRKRTIELFIGSANTITQITSQGLNKDIQ
jgi:hypothetical protein